MTHLTRLLLREKSSLIKALSPICNLRCVHNTIFLKPILYEIRIKDKQLNKYGRKKGNDLCTEVNTVYNRPLLTKKFKV